MISMSRVELEYERECRRRRYLPIQLAATKRKLDSLYAEARRLGLDDLLNEPKGLRANQILDDPQHVNRAWDREVEIAKRGSDE